ncbi:MAG: hypothetical protein Fur0018_27590 [Anaerolineales bacterium]
MKTVQRTFIPVALALAGSLFLELAGDIRGREGFPWDAPLMNALHGYQSPLLDAAMKTVTETAAAGAVLVFLALLFWLWWQSAWREMGGAALSFLGAVSSNTALKLFFSRPRPTVFVPLVVEHSYSFPSGHSVAAMSLYGFLAVTLWRRGYRAPAILAAGWPFLVALSRVYLGVHYPSDVLGGLAFGALWLLTGVFLSR